jgi:hypothetical protein
MLLNDEVTVCLSHFTILHKPLNTTMMTDKKKVREESSFGLFQGITWSCKHK